MAPNRRNPIPPSALEQRAPYGQPAGGDRGKTKSEKSVRTCFTSDLCSGFTLGSTSFLYSNSPLPSGYPPHFYYRKRKHTFLITSFCIRSFPSFYRMGVLFAQNKRIFSHTSYPERAFSALPCRLSVQSFPPDTGTKPRTSLWVQTRTSILGRLTASCGGFLNKLSVKLAVSFKSYNPELRNQFIPC